MKTNQISTLWMRSSVNALSFSEPGFTEQVDCDDVDTSGYVWLSPETSGQGREYSRCALGVDKYGQVTGYPCAKLAPNLEKLNESGRKALCNKVDT